MQSNHPDATLPAEDQSSDGQAAGKPGREPTAAERLSLSGAAAEPQTNGLPKMRVFRNVPVVPTVKIFAQGQLSDGGPIWPDFHARTAIRHKRRGMVRDRRPNLPRGACRIIEQPCVWAGYATTHFGHLIAEHLTRVLQSVTERPNDLFLFVTAPGVTVEMLPGFFWSILEWYGLTRDRVMIVTEPLIVRTLRVVPESEQWDFGEPADAYLDLLDRLPAKNGVVPIESDLLYVSRVGLVKAMKGGHAGEAYLVSQLEALGVRVMDPTIATLAEQLALYAGAKAILFAEGSAIHCRQLLGRLRQKIGVVVRRPGKKVGAGVLTKRCDELSYFEATGRFVTYRGSNGLHYVWQGISFYDPAILHECFRQFGVDLSSVWSQEDYLAMRDFDAMDWLDSVPKLRINVTTDSYAEILGMFEEEGVKPRSEHASRP